MLSLTKISLDTIIDNFSEALLIINEDGQIIRSNQRTEHVLGYTNDEIVGKNLGVLFRNKHVDLDDILRFLEVDELTFEETVLLRKGRKQFHARMRLKRHHESGLQMVFISDVDARVNYRLSVERNVSAIEKLTKSRHIRTGQLEKAINEIIETASRTISVQRVNVWTVPEDFSLLKCIGSYNAAEKKFSIEADLPQQSAPAYFGLLQTEEVIVCNDTLKDKRVKELLEAYIKPHNIRSMMDFPVRIEGKMIGVVCFEHTGFQREWDINDQKFGMFIAHLLSLTLETHERQCSNKELQTLLREINHRTKNNLNISVSLLRLQMEHAKDDFHRDLFMECSNRLLSIASLHQLLYQTDSFSKVELGSYLSKIAGFANDSFNAEKKAVLKINFEEVKVGITTAVSLGLIANELVTNAYKHAFPGKKKGLVHLELTLEEKKACLCIRDNGKGIDKADLKKDSLGMTLIKQLTEQIGAKISWENANGTTVRVLFSLK